MILTSIVSLPSWTAVSNNGNMVSSPGNPGGAFSESFSETEWGAEVKINYYHYHHHHYYYYYIAYHDRLQNNRLYPNYPTMLVDPRRRQALVERVLWLVQFSRRHLELRTGDEAQLHTWLENLSLSSLELPRSKSQQMLFVKSKRSLVLKGNSSQNIDTVDMKHYYSQSFGVSTFNQFSYRD